MNFNQHVKRICIPEDLSKSVLQITSTEIENSEVDDETGQTLVEYKSLWRKPITVSFDPNGAEGNVPDVNTRYGLDWEVPSIVAGDDALLYHPSNFEFVGWSLDPTAPSDKTGTEEQFVFEPGSNGPLDKDDFTMHAIWDQQDPNLDEYITVYEKNGPVTNDSFTIPYDGTYKFYVASGGGGGAAWWRTHRHRHKEGQGGYGYWGTFECNLAKGDVVKIPLIGRGGAGDEHHGGEGGSDGNAYGGNGGSTDLYVSRKFHVTMTGGNGGQAHGGTHDGRNGGLTRHDGVDVVKERMLRWVLPNAFGIPYANELSAWAISGIKNNNTKLPTSNTNTYKNGKTYKQFWTAYLKTMQKFLDDFKGSVDLQYGTPDIFQTVKKYRPAWIRYNSPDPEYKSSPEIINLATTSVKDLDKKSNIWVKDADNEYTCSFQDKSLDDIAKMVIKNYGVKSTDGNRGTASYKSATSGVHGCVKILVKAISKYIVIWNGNGGTSPSPNSTEVEHTFAIRTAISTLPTSTRTGYTQNKWWTSAAGGSEVTLDTIVNNSFTAYAHWTPNTYTITWDSQGGVDSIPNWSVTYGLTLGSHGDLPIPTREGFEFGNWWTSAEGGTQVTAGTSVPASNTTYYAHWNESRPEQTGFHSVLAINNNNCSWPFKQENFSATPTKIENDLEYIRNGRDGITLTAYENPSATGFTITVKQWQSTDVTLDYPIQVGASSNGFADAEGILFQWTADNQCGPNATQTYCKSVNGDKFSGNSVTLFVSNTSGTNFDSTKCGIKDFDEFKLTKNGEVVISASVCVNWFYD